MQHNQISDKLLFVYLDHQKKSDTRTSKLSSFEEDVLDICKKVDAYMNIVKETTRHMVPKAITLYIIRELENFINNDLLTTITSDSNEKYVSILRILLCDLAKCIQANISKHYNMIINQFK